MEEEIFGSLSIRLWHPFWDFEMVSSLLSIPTFRIWLAGAARTTPIGTPLPGLYRNSYWCSESLEFSSRLFKKEVADALDRIETQRQYFEKLNNSGGTVQIYLHLPGSVNNGDVLNYSLLKRFADLGVNLAIEVFPDMG